MDIGDTLARIFPTGVVSYGNTDQGGFFKVLSLPQGTVRSRFSSCPKARFRKTARCWQAAGPSSLVDARAESVTWSKQKTS